MSLTGRALAAALALSLAAGGAACGSEQRVGGQLRWARPPQILRHPSVPADRVLRGVVRNDGTRPVEVAASDVRLLDSEGRRVPGVATFAAGFLHGLHPPSREPAELSESEQRRLGRKALLRPGEQVTLTLAWRQLPGRKPPVSVSYGAGRLRLPAGG